MKSFKIVLDMKEVYLIGCTHNRDAAILSDN